MPDADYCEIPLGGPHTKRRGIALVDAADAEAVSPFSWYMHSKGYAARGTRVGGKQLVVFMHRFLLGLEPGDLRQTDHVNGDKLDNRRVNLRICTVGQNGQNRHQCGPYRGTHWDAWAKRWRAQVELDGKLHRLGRFATREEAAEVAAAFRREHMPFSADARAANPST